MKKIAVAIPTKNEADAIAHTTTIIDRGLQHFNDIAELTIVNIDSQSSDNTQKIFLGTPTSSKKMILKPFRDLPGKGANLLSFISFCKKESIEFAATIDADITTIEENWIQKLLSPLIEQRAVFSTPLYERSPFEGSTTNHFAFPYIWSTYGLPLRQPIGGEYAFSKRALASIPDSVSPAVMKYGIDIFLVSSLLQSHMQPIEVFLGKKNHKPSFTKIVDMSAEVIEAAATFYAKTEKHPPILPLPREERGMAKQTIFLHKKESTSILELVQQSIKKNKLAYKNIFGAHATQASLETPAMISSELWVDIFCKAFRSLEKKILSPKEFASFLSPLMVVRSISFWLEAESLPPEESEKRIIEQAEKIVHCMRKT